ncbi:PEP-CTERM sorting domain-containing protein [Thermoleptolyngbya sp.]
MAPTPEPPRLLGLVGAGALGVDLRRRKRKRSLQARQAPS